MKRFVAIAVLTGMLFVFVGCAPAPAVSTLSSGTSSSSESSSEVSEIYDPAEHSLAFCMGSYNHPVLRLALLGFIDSAQTLGYKNVLISGLADQSTSEELIEKWNSDLAANNVSGVVVWTGDDSCYEMMKRWNKQGIKIVIPFFTHSYNDYDAGKFVGANIDAYSLYSDGVIAADYIGTTLRKNGITSGVVAVSQPGTGVTENETTDGFVERMIDAYPEFELTPVIFEGATLEDSILRLQQRLPENANIVAAFGSTGGSAQAWSAATAETGIDDCIIVGPDFLEINLELLQSGKIDALISRPVYESGYDSVLTLDRLLRGEVFNEDEWQPECNCILITADGTGKNGVQYYLDLWERVKTFDIDKYLT